MDKLTDEIVEDIIRRVANCTDRVQTVFLEQGLVHCFDKICKVWCYSYCTLSTYFIFSCKVPAMDDEKLLIFLNKVAYHVYLLLCCCLEYLLKLSFKKPFTQLIK